MSKPGASRSEWPASVWRIRRLERTGMAVLLVLLVLGVFVVPVVLPSGAAGRLALDLGRLLSLPASERSSSDGPTSAPGSP